MIDTKAVRALLEDLEAWRHLHFEGICSIDESRQKAYMLVIDHHKTIRQFADEIDTLRAALDKYGDGMDWIQRAMQAEIERDTLRELVREVYKRGMVWPEWDERARKALKGTKWATI